MVFFGNRLRKKALKSKGIKVEYKPIIIIMAGDARHGANLMPAPFYNPSPTPGYSSSDLVYGMLI